MPNLFNYRCPKCGCPDEIQICAFVSVHLTGNGAEIGEDVSDIDGPNDYWTSENAAGCDACGFQGAVKDFEPTGATVIELFPPAGKPKVMNFAATADELHRQERARLAATVTPRPEQLRSMTAAALRVEIAGMWERLGHDIITGPDAAELVTVKAERKFLTMCANPADLALTGSATLRRLRDRVVAASAERGFYVSVRGFTAEATHYAETAPVELIDGVALIRALQRSRKGMLLPQSYKAMCRQCGEIVQHRLDSDEAKRCGSGHFVAPTIARADLVKPRQPAPGQTVTGEPTPVSTPKIIKYRNMSAKAQHRRQIRAHNRRAWAGQQRQQ